MKLEEGEFLVARVKKHWMSLVLPIIAITILHILIVPFFWGIYKVARYFRDEILLTNKNFYVKVGLLERESQGVSLDKISKVDYTQNFFGRKLDYGTLYVHTAATYGGIDYSYIANPENVKKSIEEVLAATKANDDKTS